MKWVRDVGPISPVILAWDLGRGETEVLNWAYGHSGYEAILDDWITIYRSFNSLARLAPSFIYKSCNS